MWKALELEAGDTLGTEVNIPDVVEGSLRLVTRSPDPEAPVCQERKPLRPIKDQGSP